MAVKSAIEAGDIESLTRLLASDRSLADTPIRWGKNNELECVPLHFVCDKVFDRTISREQAVALARELIGAGADLNARNGDPLNAAVSLGVSEVASVLLDRGARVDLRGTLGETSLHWAAHMGNAAIARRLLELGAPTDVRDDKWQGTPLEWARHGAKDSPRAGHADVIAALSG